MEMYKFIESRFKSMHPLIRQCLLWTWSFLSVYGIWFLLHSLSAKLYSEHCVKFSVFGLLESFVMVHSPICKILRFTMNIGVEVMCSLWVLIFAYLNAMIANLFPNINVKAYQ